MGTLPTKNSDNGMVSFFRTGDVGRFDRGPTGIAIRAAISA